MSSDEVSVPIHMLNAATEVMRDQREALDVLRKRTAELEERNRLLNQRVNKLTLRARRGETPRKTVAQVAKEWGEKPINKYIDTELVDPVFAKGYAQGLEDAAKVCDDIRAAYMTQWAKSAATACIAAIRALQKEGK